MMDIIIDHRIRDWVFIPLILVMFLVSVFRVYLTQYLENKKTSTKVTSKQSVNDIVDKNILQKSQQLFLLNGLISEQSFKMRRAYLCNQETGVLTKASSRPPKDPMANMPMMNPSSMADMLKGNLTSVFSMALQYQWVSYFFSGFIIGKAPFPLTQKFRGMLQRGVDIQNLDVRYISSLSLYFLILFGVSKLHGLLLSGDDDEEIIVVDDIQQMNMMPMQQMQMPGMNQNQGKQYQMEKENLEGVRHKFQLNKQEKKAIEQMRQLIQQK